MGPYRVFIKFSDRPTNSHINEKLSPSPFHRYMLVCGPKWSENGPMVPFYPHPKMGVDVPKTGIIFISAREDATFMTE